MNTKDRRGGFYFVGEKPYISVTNILKIIDKPAIQYWFGNQIYWAMVKDPNLDEKTAMSSPYKVSGDAKSRGTTVHSIVEAWKNIGDVKGLDGQFAGYAKAFDMWRQDYNPEPLEHERTIISEKYGYAGTLDLIANVNGVKCLIDVKTNKDANLYDEVQLQLTAYLQGLEEAGEKIERMYALSLGEGGKYNFKQYEPDLETFLSAKRLWEWSNKNKLEKIGYEGGAFN